jgi:predicted nucleotide-binding protein
VNFAIILLSPDDVGSSKDESIELRPRARQNVILELGFFLGKLGRGNVFVLLKKATDFELPSDFSGVVYCAYDNTMVWQYKLVKELQASDYDVDANKL